MTADGSVKELKSLLANKCGLPVSKVRSFVLLHTFVHANIRA